MERVANASESSTTRWQEPSLDTDARQSNPLVIPSLLPSLAQNILSYLFLLGGVLTILAMAYLTWTPSREVRYDRSLSQWTARS
jgi:hypothetical protein